MRLFLSSYKIGDHGDKLHQLVGENKKVAMIINAQDYKIPAERKESSDKEKADLVRAGFEPFEVDLRDFFDSPIQVEDLKGAGLIWVRGGNVFVLRMAMLLSGFDSLLVDSLQKELFSYGGYSAAGCVLSPSLIGYDIVDDPTMTKRAYNLEPNYSGLSVINYTFEPHYKSEHPESADIDKEIEKLDKLGLPYKTLRDGLAIIVDGDKEELVG